MTANPAFFQDDSPETITASKILGVSHAPSYPLHTLLGACFQWIHLGNPAFSYTFLSLILSSFGSVLVSFCLWMFFNSSRHLPDDNKPREKLLNLLVFFGGSELAFAKSYWSASLSAKGSIYIFQTILTLISIFQLIKFVNAQRESIIPADKSQNYFLGFIYIFVLGFSHHWQSQLLLLPLAIFLIIVMLHRIRLMKRTPSIIFSAASLCVISLSLYLYLPLRANQHPVLNIGIPNNWSRFLESVSRAEARKIESGLPVTIPVDKTTAFLSRLSSSMLSDLNEKTNYIVNHFREELDWVPGSLCLLGIIFIKKLRNIIIVFFVLWTIFTFLLANLFYMRLQPIEYWHLDNYLLGSTWGLVFLSTFGLNWIFRWAVARSAKPNNHFRVFTGFIVLLLFLTFSNSLKTSNMSKELLYYQYGEYISKSLPKDSIYFAETDYDYFSSLYMKFVLNKRLDTELVFTPFFKKRWLQSEFKSQYPNLPIDRPIITTLNSPGSAPDLFTEVVHTNQNIRPICFTFTNGIFSEFYLKKNHSLKFLPTGLLLQINLKSQLLCPSSSSALNDFWDHSLRQALNRPLPMNYFLLNACVHPYLNTAYYWKARGDMSRWDNWLEKAAMTTGDPIWKIQILREKGDGDLAVGKKQEAVQSFNSCVAIAEMFNRQDLAESILKELSIMNIAFSK